MAGAVFCDGWKRTILIFAGRHDGFLRFLMFGEVDVLSAFLVSDVCSYLSVNGKHVDFAWQGQ